jgi:uncharacterized protein YjdB
MKPSTLFTPMIRQIIALSVMAISWQAATAQPVVSSLSSYSAVAGATITITGTSFNTTAANDLVSFGAVTATVTAATVTSLTVTVPYGATYGPVSVTDASTGLTGYGEYPFFCTYNNSSYVAGTINFATKVDSVTGAFPNHTTYADIDGDGKVDIITNNYTAGTITVLRNTGSAGTVSFAAPVTIATLTNPSFSVAGDMDGDGKPDVVVMTTGVANIYRNTSTPGTISFAAGVTSSIGSGVNIVAIADIDGDGKADIITAGSVVSVVRNTGSIGSLSFAAHKDFAVLGSTATVSAGDIDGDGKADVIVGYTASNISVFRNTSTSGNVNFSVRQDFVSGGHSNFIGLADIDGDGKMDIISPNSGTIFSLFPNNSSVDTVILGTKLDITIGNNAGAFSMGDFDGDGKADIAISSISSGGVYVYRNTSSAGSFSFATAVVFATGNGPAGVTVADMDGDGKPDIVTGNQSSNTISVLLNKPLQPIAGATTVCKGSTLTLSDATSGGTWSTANTTVATVVSTTGVVTGKAAGTAAITYAGTAGASYTGNVVTTTVTVLTVPTVSTVSPEVGYAGSTVTISGTGFNPTGSNDIVFFGATQAMVSSASTTLLSVTVPTGSAYMPVTVENVVCGLTGGYSTIPFLTNYNNGAYVADSLNFDAKVEITAPATTIHEAIADLDGDGKADMIVVDGVAVVIYRNISTSGTITTGSFDAGISYPITGADGVVAGDVDGDGKQDIVVFDGNATNTVTVLRNSSTPGTISLATGVTFNTGTGPHTGAIGDIDGDGKPEIIVANYNANTVSVLRNTSSAGSITSGSFAAKVDYATGSLPYNLAVADIDGDGKPDIVTGNNGDGTVSVLRNTATSGVINSSSLAAKVGFVAGTNPDVTVGDVDGDGKLDIITANYYSNTISVLRNTATSGSITSGSFATKVDFTTSTGPNNVVIADIDGDGKPDLAVSGAGTNKVSIFRNISSPGSITSSSLTGKIDIVVDTLPFWVDAADLDGDGKADIIVTNTISGSVSVFRNEPILPITGTLSVCPGATTTLSDGTTGGAWSSNNTAVATIDASSGIVTGLSAGTATINYQMVIGRVTATLTVNPLPVVGPITGGTPVCTGTTLSLSDTTTGGVWSTSNTSISSVSGGVVSVSSAGTAIISYSVTNICTTVATDTITIILTPSVGFVGGAASVCVGASASLSSGAPGGVWSSNNTAVATMTGNLVIGISGGTATLRYTLTNSCGTSSVTHGITVKTLPAAGSIAGSLMTCVGASTTLTDAATGGAWSSNNTSLATVAGGVVNGVGTGTATISYAVTNTCGTSTTDTTITIGTVPSVGVINGLTSVCAGSAVTLTDATTAGVWSSTNTTAGISGGLVTGVAAGTDTINYSVTNTCGTTTVTHTVTVNPPPVAGTITGASAVCAGSTITLTDAAGGGVWSSSNTTATVSGGVVSGVTAGNDIIKYTVTNTCGTATASQTITVNPLPVAGTISGASTVCAGSTITLTDAASGGVWSSSNTVASVSAGTVSGIAAGTATISYSVTNTCGTAIATTIVTINPLPSAGTIAGASAVCPGSAITLTDATTGGFWSSTNTKATVSGGVVTGVSAGIDTIKYAVSNSCGTATATQAVTINPLPAAGTIGGLSAVCTGATIILSDATTGGAWSVSNIKATVSLGVVAGISPGIDTVKYSVTNSCGTATAIHTVTINATPSAITGASPVCSGSTISLSDALTGGTWASSNTTIATVVPVSGIVTGVSAGTAGITYTLTGCTATGSVTVNPLPAVYTVSGGGSYCAGDTGVHIFLSGSVAGINYQLYKGGSSFGGVVAGTGSSLDLGPDTAAGSFTMTGTDAVTACKSNMTGGITISINPLPAAITGTEDVCTGSTTNLSDATSGGKWSSSNTTLATVGSGTGIVTGAGVGIPSITYTLSTGCKAMTSVTVNPEPSAITGVAQVCAGSATALSDAGGGAWSSSNTSLAVVSGAGVVTGVAAGTPVIIYKLPTGCFASKSVTVNPLPGPIAGTASVCVNAATGLSDVPAGGAWSSGNTAIAAIDGAGSVTGVVAGSATITYTLPTGCLTSTEVAVNPLPFAGTIAGAASVCLDSTVVLADATGGGIWSSNNSAATVTGTGTVTGLSVGADTILYSVTNGCGTANASWPFDVVQCDHTNVPLVVNTPADIKVFPNPNKGNFTISGTLGKSDDSEVSIGLTDLLGQVVYRNNVVAIHGNISEQVTLKNTIANGVYLLTIRSGSSNIVLHIVIAQ